MAVHDVENFSLQASRCVDKTRYLDKADAKRAEKYLRRRYGHELRVYHCPVCDRWHLTHQGMK